MTDDRSKWNERYREAGFFLGPHPSRFLVEQLDRIMLLAPGRRAIDLACGEGRNSIFLARHGFMVTGIDLAEEGIAKGERRMVEEGVTVDFRVADLEGYVFTGTYDLIINFNFLLRDIIPKGVNALTPGGVFVFESILDSPALIGHHNPNFLLRPGELHARFAAFPGIIHLSEEFPCNENPTARLIFQRSGNPLLSC